MPTTNHQTAINLQGALFRETGFTAYDLSCNPYVGCSYGCSYCYVRKVFPVDWGNFVNERKSVMQRLQQAEVGGKIAIGTDCDPYQPIEQKARITRTILQGLSEKKDVTKVGIFTRSPNVVSDADLIAFLPRGRVHFTISPYLEEDRQVVERMRVTNGERFQAIWRLKELGIPVIANVSPSIPLISDQTVEELAKTLMHVGVDEVCVGLTCLYQGVRMHLINTLKKHPFGDEIIDHYINVPLYRAWKKEYRARWAKAWTSDKLIIWRDTHFKGWEELKTGEPLPKEYYA